MIEPEGCARNWNWPRRLGKIDNLQSVIVGNESVTELDRNTARIAQKTIGQFTGDAGMGRIRNIDNEKSSRCGQVKAMSGRGDKCRASQNAVRIETNGLAFFQEIVVRISVDERGDIADDESFFAVGDVNERVEKIDRLLFVFGKMLACGIERERTRQCETGRVFRVNPGALAKRRDR